MIVFSDEDHRKLSAAHVSIGLFAELHLPSGVSYLWGGMGKHIIDGKTYRGVSNPVSGQLVSISGLQEDRFGAAAAVTITLAGANKEFLQSVHDTALEIEGQRAKIGFATFDQERQEVLIGIRNLFNGRMTAPTIAFQSRALRTVSITIEGRFSGLNYSSAERFSHEGQQRRYPGDLGMEFMGVEVSEQFK
jgi:hypothetical protein